MWEVGGLEISHGGCAGDHPGEVSHRRWRMSHRLQGLDHLRLSCTSASQDTGKDAFVQDPVQSSDRRITKEPLVCGLDTGLSAGCSAVQGKASTSNCRLLALRESRCS